jgi:HSP20 family protein
MTLKSLIKRGYDDFNIRKVFEDFDEPYWDNYLMKPFENFRFNFVPKVDITEDKDNLYIMAEIPGISKDNVKVTMVEDLLTISGEKKKEETEEKQNYYRLERNEGFFTRSFTLPVKVKSEKIKAEFKDGVLNIALPKVEEAKRIEKEIAIL